MGSGEGGTLTNAVLTHRQMFNSGQLKKRKSCVHLIWGGRAALEEGGQLSKSRDDAVDSTSRVLRLNWNHFAELIFSPFVKKVEQPLSDSQV